MPVKQKQPVSEDVRVPKKGSRTIVEVSGLYKSFQVGQQTIPVLHGIDFTVPEDDFLIIFGPSGCGKSTLLHSLLGLEPPTQGSVRHFGVDIYDGKTEDDRAEFRKKNIGMVYQQSNWIKALNVIENVAFPLMLGGKGKEESLEEAGNMLKAIGMLDWGMHKPMDLSSGQQQRVALARALVTDPELIIADEPTGNLDFEAGQTLIHLLVDLSHLQKTVIMVTHDLEYLYCAKTALHMVDGRIKGIYRGEEKEKLQHELQYKKMSGV